MSWNFQADGRKNGGYVCSGKFPGCFSTRSGSSPIWWLNFDPRTREALMLLFRDPTEALPGELSIVYPLAGAQADAEGIVVFKKGPGYRSRANRAFFMSFRRQRGGPPHGFRLRHGDPPLPASNEASEMGDKN